MNNIRLDGIIRDNRALMMLGVGFLDMINGLLCGPGDRFVRA